MSTTSLDNGPFGRLGMFVSRLGIERASTGLLCKWYRHDDNLDRLPEFANGRFGEAFRTARNLTQQTGISHRVVALNPNGYRQAVIETFWASEWTDEEGEQ